MIDREQVVELRERKSPSNVIDHNRSIRSISITSGKGGVGKSNVVINLAIALQRLGMRVLVMDGDFSLANLDILLNLDTRVTLNDVLFKGKNIQDIIIQDREGIDVIPASSGVLEMTKIGIQEKSMILSMMQEIDKRYDVLLIDTGAGISDEVIWLNSSVNDIVIVVTPEPTSITDSYALIKVVSQEYKISRFNLLINQVSSEREALNVFDRLSNATDKFLNVNLNYFGFIKNDSYLGKAVKERRPVISRYPSAPSSLNFLNVAKNILREKSFDQISSHNQFFWQAYMANA